MQVRRLFNPLSTLLCVIAPLGFVSCDDQSKKVNDTPPAALPSVSRQVEEAAPSFDEDSFRVSIQSVGEAIVGKESQVRVVLEPKAPFKSNDEYPYKFKVKNSEAIVANQDVVKRGQMKVTPERTEFQLAVKPMRPGTHEVAGTFSFSVCTDDSCLIEKKKLALKLNAEDAPVGAPGVAGTSKVP